MMKRIHAIIFSLSIFLPIFFTANLVKAADVNGNVDCTQAPTSAFCQQTGGTDNPIFGPKGILTRGGLILAFLTGAISVFMLIWGGLKFVMSTGDPQKITTARNTVLYASIGVVVAVSAAAIVQFILKRL